MALESTALGVFPLSTYSDTLYEGTISWCGAEVKLSLSVEAIESIAPVFLVAASILEASSKLNDQVAMLAAAELLPSINEARRAARSSVLSHADFLQSISLQTISVHSDETYEFLFDDGELLGGHWIEVHGNLKQGPIEVDTPG